MNKKERWNKIVNLCLLQDKVTTEEIAEALKVSLATVRRDLLQMEDLHMIERYHGGAFLTEKQHSEPPMLLKSNTNKSIKNSIGRYAASKIKDNMMVYIDAGSTTYEMIPYIRAKNVTIACIGIPHIIKLSEKEINLIIIGGTYKKSTSAITGLHTLKHLDELYFDIAFLGTNGIHPVMGYTTTNDSESAVKHKVVERSDKTYILADDTKLNKISQSTFSTLNSATVIINDISNFNSDQIVYELINN